MLEAMDWQQQWELFAPNFKEGKAHIETPGGIIKLLPGPGFGDFSHPTTRLTMRLMSSHVKDRPIVDIGCGSGILSFAAAAMGAQSVYGYDIDREAVEHAQKNLSLNRGNITFGTSPPPNISSDTIVLMNMISSEQAKAWKHSFLPEILITSGVLEQDQSSYLAWAATLGWSLHYTACEDGWCGFVFSLTCSTFFLQASDRL